MRVAGSSTVAILLPLQQSSSLAQKGDDCWLNISALCSNAAVWRNRVKYPMSKDKGLLQPLQIVGCFPTVRCLARHCGLYPVHTHTRKSANALQASSCG